MASTSSTTLTTISSSFDAKAPPTPRQSPSATSPHGVTIPSVTPPLVQSQSRPWKTTAFCRKIARNVMSMATREAPSDVVASSELSDFVKTAQEAWDKVEDKYAVSSLVVAGVIFIWGSTGMIAAIDRLPIVPGIFELVGIGYTGWFAYKNLVFKPDREALLQKIKDTYKDVTGSS